ncbi:MAG: hypothetical protein AAFV53_34740 [Myxococcota bacterium]
MPRPFTVDPAVMDQIRPMMNIDADAVARLHHAAMGNSLWAKLGLPFLKTLYRALVVNDRFLGFVYVDERNIPRGFIAGSTDARAMMREVFEQSYLVLGMNAFPRALRPAILLRLLQTPRYFRASHPGDEIPAESLFCSFEPELRGKRISGHINKVLFDELLARGHDQVKITTEATNQGANRQLQSWGFEERGRFRFYEHEMVAYVLNLHESDRVEAVSRHPAV